MWLAGLYAPGMASVNANFIPPMWFSASIFAMEVVVIGFPIAEIFKTHKLRQETLDAIAAWEKRQEMASPDSSAFSDYSAKHGSRSSKSFTIHDYSRTKGSSVNSQRSDLYTMAGLENALRTNPVPLLQFAALRDFSGENISFLTHLADWRCSWLHLTGSTALHRRQQFAVAVQIYALFVSPNFSEFPINVSHQSMRALRDLFEEPASFLCRKRSTSATYSPTPFKDVSPDSDSTVDLRSGVKLDNLGRAKLNSVAHVAGPEQDDILADFPIPDTFKETVFDNAEGEIKYLVLTNTWPKFVNNAYASSQVDTEKDLQHRKWFGKTVIRVKQLRN